MGAHDVSSKHGAEERREFTRQVLLDLDALERMLAEDRFERGVVRFGVEQEMFLVTSEGRAAPIAHTLLSGLEGDVFTSELAQYNLEANLPPRPLDGDFLRWLHESLDHVMTQTAAACAEHDAVPLLTGILPSLRDTDLSLLRMSHEPRYRLLNERIFKERGGRPQNIFIRGVDVLEIESDSIMLEAANTSLQLHLQVDPEDFARLYNLAQAISGPLLAAAVNSPLLLGRRLWSETRVALFERATDERTDGQIRRGSRPRVSFGEGWVEGSVLHVFREDVARFRVLLTGDAGPNPLEVLDRGGLPPLKALGLHNGTIWRWNRACFGVGESTAHLRVENRVLPAGPTVIDEVANAALFYGLMTELDHQYPDLTERMRFDHAKENLLSAARRGLDACFDWVDGRRCHAADLILAELLPAARRGLERLNVPQADRDDFLGVIEARVRSDRTGATWLLDGLEVLRSRERPEAALTSLTRELMERSASGRPVHEWPPVDPDGRERRPGSVVRDVMSTNLYTVRSIDAVDLAERLMAWRAVNHVPVEDAAGRPVGLVTPASVARARDTVRPGAVCDLAVSDAMEASPTNVPPDLDLESARAALRSEPTGCLLVTSDGQLIGIVTRDDLSVDG